MRCGTCEALAEYYDIALVPPDLPEAHHNTYTKYSEWVVGQMTDFYPLKAGTLRTSSSFSADDSAAKWRPSRR